jgi:regulatory protein
MHVTQIRQQVKQSGRYSIYIDNKYSFSLSESALLEFKIAIGQEFDSNKLKELKNASAADKAYNQALRYIAIRPRSLWEMESYLKRKQVDDDTAHNILNKLSNLSLLDDLAFARAWIQNRRLLKITSKRKLTQELRQKRVDDDTINSVLSEDETDERDILKQLIIKKRQQSRYNDRLKLMQYLSRQGFNYDDIKATIDNTDE